MIPLTFRHRAGVSPYTSPYGLAETCVFGKQSPGPFHCGLVFTRHPLFRSYGVNMPSSLTTLLPLALGFSPHLPVSVCGTGVLDIHKAFLASFQTDFHSIVSLSTGATNARLSPSKVSLCLNLRRLRNFYRMCIGYAFPPHLSSRLTLRGRTFLRKP